MKELDSFTVERLEELTYLMDFHKEWHPTLYEIKALARIALAAKRAEPVAWVVGDATLYNSDTVEAYAKRSGLPVSPLYTTPRLNSPQGWIKCSDQMPEDDTLCLGVDEFGVIWAMHFDDGEWQADTGHVDDLKISHWMPLPTAPEKENG